MELSVEEVIQAFRAVTGEDVRIAGGFKHPEFASGWSRLDLADERARSKFGSFHLTAFDDLEGARRQGSLPEQDRLEIRWQYLAVDEFRPSPAWSASLSYRNVHLKWWPEQKQVDERWHRLAAVIDYLQRKHE